MSKQLLLLTLIVFPFNIHPTQKLFSQLLPLAKIGAPSFIMGFAAHKYFNTQTTIKLSKSSSEPHHDADLSDEQKQLIVNFLHLHTSRTNSDHLSIEQKTRIADLLEQEIASYPLLPPEQQALVVQQINSSKKCAAKNNGDAFLQTE